MSDLISREALMEFARNHVGHTIGCNDIARFPAVEAESVRHGEWIIKKRWSMGKWHKWLECSECKYQDHNLETYEATPFTGPSNYCPNCGAKMDLKKKRNEDAVD